MIYKRHVVKVFWYSTNTDFLNGFKSKATVCATTMPQAIAFRTVDDQLELSEIEASANRTQRAFAGDVFNRSMDEPVDFVKHVNVHVLPSSVWIDAAWRAAGERIRRCRL